MNGHLLFSFKLLDGLDNSKYVFVDFLSNCLTSSVHAVMSYPIDNLSYISKLTHLPVKTSVGIRYCVYCENIFAILGNGVNCLYAIKYSNNKLI